MAEREGFEPPLNRQPKSLIECAFRLVNSELERETRCQCAQPRQAKTRLLANPWQIFPLTVYSLFGYDVRLFGGSTRHRAKPFRTVLLKASSWSRGARCCISNSSVSLQFHPSDHKFACSVMREFTAHVRTGNSQAARYRWRAVQRSEFSAQDPCGRDLVALLLDRFHPEAASAGQAECAGCLRLLLV